MKKSICLILPLAVFIIIASPNCFADIIYLKNGEKIEGNIVGRAYDYIIVRIPVSERKMTPDSVSVDFDLDREVYFYEIDKIQYDSGIIEIVSKMRRVKIKEEAVSDESSPSAEQQELNKEISFRIDNNSSITPSVEIVVQNEAGIDLPFTPNVNIENKDGVIIDHLQERDITLKDDLEVYYIGLKPFEIENPPLLYKVKKIEIDSKKSAEITLELGEVVRSW